MTWLSLLKSIGVVSNVTTFDFKLAKSTFLANLDAMMPVTFLKSDYVA